MMDKERRREDDGGRVLYLKVMTDEQVEVLRRQIAVYAAICEQLVEMHRAFAAQQDALAGMKIGGVYADSLMVPGAHKITARQRWTPTSMQLQILESIFEQGHGTPCKQNLLKITQELSQHGEISEANVYNWFQNRRARSKRKQTAAVHGNTGPEIEADDESSSDMKSKPDNGHPNDMCLPNQSACDVQTNNKMHFGDTWLDHTRTYQFDESSKSSSDSAQMLCFGNASSDDGLHHLIADLDIPGSVCPFQTSGENGYMA